MRICTREALWSIGFQFSFEGSTGAAVSTPAENAPSLSCWWRRQPLCHMISWLFRDWWSCRCWHGLCRGSAVRRARSPTICVPTFWMQCWSLESVGLPLIRRIQSLCLWPWEWLWCLPTWQGRIFPWSRFWLRRLRSCPSWWSTRRLSLSPQRICMWCYIAKCLWLSSLKTVHCGNLLSSSPRSIRL